jgi:hypothetical protein
VRSMTIKTPLRAVDLANELGKDKRTILNWLKHAYEKNEGCFAGLRIVKEDWNGNFTYLITPEDWETFKQVHMQEIPENSYEKDVSYVSTPPRMSEAGNASAMTNGDLSHFFDYLREKDEQVHGMINRVIHAESQLKLLTDGREHADRAYQELQQSHYEALARIKQLEAELQAKDQEIEQFKATLNLSDSGKDKPFWKKKLW